VSQDLEIVARDNNLCGEAPIWDAARRRLIWTDVSSNSVYAFAPESGEKRIISRDLTVSGIALNRTGGLVFGGPGGLFLWRENSSCRLLLADPADQPFCFNDLIADSKGRIYAGTYYWGSAGMEKRGNLYLFEPTGAIKCVDEGIELSNGLGSVLAIACSTTPIRRHDRSSHMMSMPRRVFSPIEGRSCAFPAEEGIPDGLTVDSAGYVWCALWYGGQVVRYDPDGAVERRISCPSSKYRASHSVVTT